MRFDISEIWLFLNLVDRCELGMCWWQSTARCSSRLKSRPFVKCSLELLALASHWWSREVRMRGTRVIICHFCVIGCHLCVIACHFWSISVYLYVIFDDSLGDDGPACLCVCLSLSLSVSVCLSVCGPTENKLESVDLIRSVISD